MFDHIALTVSDFGASKTFFDKALAPLGIEVVREVPAEVTGGDGRVGYGFEGRPYFWIGTGGPSTGRLHLAFNAKDRPAVDAFHAAAVAAGGRDNGLPGIRAHYHPDYYGAFVLDLDGHNIEAVCHEPA